MQPDSAFPNGESLEYKKFIAYALIGYIDVLRRTGSGDAYINYTFSPYRLISKLKDINFPKSIIDLLEQLDEMEALIKIIPADQFERSVKKLVDPVISYLQNEISQDEQDQSVLEKIIFGK